MHDILLEARVLVRCLGQTAAIGTLIAVGVGMLGNRFRRIALLVATVLAAPGILAALWPATVLVPLPDAWKPGKAAPQWRLVPAALPLLLVFLLDRLVRLQPGQARAARGLGAGVWDRLRLVWLPQLGPPILFGLLSAALLDLLALFGSPPRF